MNSGIGSGVSIPCFDIEDPSHPESICEHAIERCPLCWRQWRDYGRTVGELVQYPEISSLSVPRTETKKGIVPGSHTVWEGTS